MTVIDQDLVTHHRNLSREAHRYAYAASAEGKTQEAARWTEEHRTRLAWSTNGGHDPQLGPAPAIHEARICRHCACLLHPTRATYAMSWLGPFVEGSSTSLCEASPSGHHELVEHQCEWVDLHPPAADPVHDLEPLNRCVICLRISHGVPECELCGSTDDVVDLGPDFPGSKKCGPCRATSPATEQSQ